jgi:hypothetical protein
MQNDGLALACPSEAAIDEPQTLHVGDVSQQHRALPTCEDPTKGFTFGGSSGKSFGFAWPARRSKELARGLDDAYLFGDSRRDEQIQRHALCFRQSRRRGLGRGRELQQIGTLAHLCSSLAATSEGRRHASNGRLVHDAPLADARFVDASRLRDGRPLGLGQHLLRRPPRHPSVEASPSPVRRQSSRQGPHGGFATLGVLRGLDSPNCLALVRPRAPAVRIRTT